MEIITSAIDSKGTTIITPDFIVNEKNQLAVQATEQGQAGRYMVLIEATLDNVLSSQAQISFILNVVANSDVNFIQIEIPEPEVQLFVHN